MAVNAMVNVNDGDDGDGDDDVQSSWRPSAEADSQQNCGRNRWATTSTSGQASSGLRRCVMSHNVCLCEILKIYFFNFVHFIFHIVT